ncbi:methyltransferase [Lysobacter sp. LF1]|uniref:Methyltransferase n=1 Tax=Lysobacter stagni TaxID=3045172 RepID=A0ABT6XD30_9GAMM|nr:methyltransferase [Lysobacter sp. LF1]MDI9238041.1 methyltransferase [Lysobacter sp. LF1]
MKRLLLVALVPALLIAHADAPAAKPAKATATATTDARLETALASSTRDPKNVVRDQYRHPRETLAFFGVKPTQTLIEITPGGGWYSEILAPYLKDGGQYVAAVYDDAIPNQPAYRYRQNTALRERFANAAVYGSPEVRGFDPKAPSFGPAGSADVVLTFRNAHNWVDEGTADAYFKGFFDVLKSGGTLGVVDHRAKPGTDLEKMKTSGYLTEALVIELAQKAGFKLQDKSEINANPKDTTDHPNGVWTLPPTNQHDAKDDAKYKAIGESDRMTLRFVKP